jgi:hypothetical protein
VCVCLNGRFCSFVMEIKSVVRCCSQSGIFIEIQSNYELILYPLHLIKFIPASVCELTTHIFTPSYVFGKVFVLGIS